MFSRYDYISQNAEAMNMGPSAEHWFGTDPAGRDLWVRNWMGARISLFIGVAVVFINTFMGCLVGGVAGYFGGKIDLIIMRIIDVLYGIPVIILAILFMVVFKPGLYTIILALVVIGWLGSARMVRGQILALKNSEFVMAARTLGAGNARIIVRHLIPNISGILITTMTMNIPNAIFWEAFMSFIGIGVQAPMCSWGSLAQLANQIYQFYPYQLVIPAFFICTTVLAFNLLGDGLRDALDPRTRGKY
jgi:oligopeptide transport system permease protein